MRGVLSKAGACVFFWWDSYVLFVVIFTMWVLLVIGFFLELPQGLVATLGRSVFRLCA